MRNMRKLMALVITMSLLSQSAFAGYKCGVSGLREVLFDGVISNTGEIRTKFKKYQKYLEPTAYAARKNKLLESIEYWARVGHRDIRMRQLRRVRVRSQLTEAMQIDSGLGIVNKLRPLFYRVQQSYYSVKRNERVITRLQRIENMIKKGESPNQAFDLLIRMERYTPSFNGQRRTMNNATLRQSIKQEIQNLKDQNIEHTYEIANHIDAYSEAVFFLQGRKAEGGVVGEKASYALKNLQGKYVVDTFLSSIGQAGSPTPKVRELRNTVDNNKIAEIRHLEKERTLERWTAVVSRLPVDKVHSILDQVVRRVPWLNKPAIRKYVRHAVDNKEVLAHYPNIDRMVTKAPGQNRGNTTHDMWEYMKTLDARENGSLSFLTTFARRSDTRPEWRRLMQYGKRRADRMRDQGFPRDTEVRLHERMVRAEREAGNLTPLAPWHHPSRAGAMRFVLDGLLLATVAAAGNFGMKFFGKIISDEDGEAEGEVINALNNVLDKELPHTDR